MQWKQLEVWYILWQKQARVCANMVEFGTGYVKNVKGLIYKKGKVKKSTLSIYIYNINAWFISRMSSYCAMKVGDPFLVFK